MVVREFFRFPVACFCSSFFDDRRSKFIAEKGNAGRFFQKTVCPDYSSARILVCLLPVVAPIQWRTRRQLGGGNPVRPDHVSPVVFLRIDRALCDCARPAQVLST